MAISYERLKRWVFEDKLTPYTRKDSLLYALSLGYGADPMDESDLRYAYEQNQIAVPTMVTVLGAPGAWYRDPESGITWLKLLHGEQRVTFHGPIAPEGVLRSKIRIHKVIDKGEGKGALVVTQRKVYDEADGRLLASVEQTSFCRADGGFGQSDEPMEPLPPTPDSAPDSIMELRTLPSAALLYRLNGDYNPIHADPTAAKAAGFPAPILHGLCTYGMAARAILKAYAEHRPAALGSFSVRFSAPFFPGETLAVHMWRSGVRVHFRALSAERNTVVLANGMATVND